MVSEIFLLINISVSSVSIWDKINVLDNALICKYKHHLNQNQKSVVNVIQYDKSFTHLLWFFQIELKINSNDSIMPKEPLLNIISGIHV